MAKDTVILGDRTLDALIFDLGSLKLTEETSDTVTAYLDGDYRAVLRNATSQALYNQLYESPRDHEIGFKRLAVDDEAGTVLVFLTGLAAFNAFLQANVTGPPLDFKGIFQNPGSNLNFKNQCLQSLDVDGVSVYQHIPYVELFCLARLVFVTYFPRIADSSSRDCRWMRIRINAYHQRLLSGLSGARLNDFSVLQDAIEKDLNGLEAELMAEESKYTTEAKVQFFLEKAQIYIMQGLDFKAKENVNLAKNVSGFSYALSGALGKRTKFQQNDTSQLVVFARRQILSTNLEKSTLPIGSADSLHTQSSSSGPTALELNDDTLLENIKFTKLESDKVDNSALPTELKDMRPDEQPQLKPLDQITLLTEATLKDTLSPLDKLSREEILPYAARVLADKPTNWQIYTQALLVRSRIESHRSRTQERSVLQLQVIVDQIIADTQEDAGSSTDGVPEIRVTQFLPRAKASESAPVYERLKYIYQLNTPTRWEIETELAYAWSNAGSLVSALEIFKRLKLWAETALCYHSVGQEDKARRVVRRQLFYSSKSADMDKYDVDAEEVVTEKWDGELRSPPPPHSPRLWCILGDLDQDPNCWQRAWEISRHRYARAQRTLGEYFTKQGDFESARAAYMKATVVNRQNSDTWSRLGDIDLAVGNWDGAVIAFQQAIMIDDTDAKTYSNLGSALLSKHAEMISLQKSAVHITASTELGDEFSLPEAKEQSPKEVLGQALKAYKRAAAIAHDNWRIWDNVITIASRMTPPSFPDILMGMRAVIRIRAPTVGENAVDVDILRALILEVTSRERQGGETVGGVYIPPRGSLARATIEMIGSDIVPLITKRPELWALVEKLKLYIRDYSGALACAEKTWRMASQGERWLQEVDEWKVVVSTTDNLASAYENYGPMEYEDGTVVENGWKLKARNAVRGIMGKAKDVWEDTPEWKVLQEKLEELKNM
ncbi:hypothetical protein B0O99DRAFT_647954 [Bisporella sp. PMI_857]|nr:hypothetical protein B0O99DRAFT_647954 [Bisporella sp. PMI_857]